MPQTTLYTIAMSHYSEKIRWILDAERRPYREVALTPFCHVLPALRLGRRGLTTVPILKDGQGSVQDSTRIIEHLDRHGGLGLLPAAHRAEIMAVEDRFDAIGKGVARYLYLSGFDHPTEILDIWTRFATPAEARFVRLAYPLIKASFRVKLRIWEGAARQAEDDIDAALQWLEARIAAQGPHLVGGRFSVADITAASLLAPMACPVEHPVYGEPRFREALAEVVNASPRWRDRPGLQWVRDTYRQHRGPVWATLPTAA